MRHYNTFHLVGDIARRLSGKKDSLPDLQSVEALSEYLAMFYNLQCLDLTTLHLQCPFNGGQVMLYIDIDRDGCFALEIRSRRYRNAQKSLFTLTISDGAVTDARTDSIGVGRIGDELASLDMIFKYVIPALGGFDDVLRVTDPETMYILKRVGMLYAERELARLFAENAAASDIDTVQKFFKECRNLNIQYTLKRRRTSP